jgi:monoamine oxidase
MTSHNGKTPDTNTVLDCAIIGGGVSGLYAGWRLRKHGSNRYGNVAVFEMSDRVGGRLLSWLPFGRGTGLRAELGGMRFCEDHKVVWNVIDHLDKAEGRDLEKVPFYTSDPHTIWLLRGQRMREGDIGMAQTRYKLQNFEQTTPDEIIKRVIDKVLQENKEVIEEKLPEKPHWLEDKWGRREWDIIKPELTYQGHLLKDWGFWNLLSTILSPEGYQYLSDSLGYYCLTSNSNAAEAVEFIALDFTVLPDFKTLKEGFGHFPEQLGVAFSEAGGKIYLKSQLLRFDRNEEGTFTLTIRRSLGEAAPFLGIDTEIFEVKARQVILAMPRGAMELLEPSRIFNLTTNQPLKHLLRSVKGVPAFKFFLLYDKRWWEKEDGGGFEYQGSRSIPHGHSVCDLPIRQTYYFRPDSCETRRMTPAEGSEYEKWGLMMVSYDDARAVEYWQEMGQQLEDEEQSRAAMGNALKKLDMMLPSFMHPLFSGVQGIEGLDGQQQAAYTPPPNLHIAPEIMIQRAIEQVELLHGQIPGSTPRPIIGAYANWSLDPYGGGWNFWNARVDVRDVMEKLSGPLQDEQGNQLQVYVVGEAYSGMQGWVEGALSTTEVVLEKNFGLERPDWLKDCYLGYGDTAMAARQTPMKTTDRELAATY